MIEFFIPGSPVAKGRGRAAIVAGHAHVFTPTKTRDYENLVKSEARRAMNGQEPLDCPVNISITVRLPIPQSMSAKKQQCAISGTLLPAKRPDLDNCVKACTDGMNMIVFRDDALICDIYASKRYSTMPGVLIKVATTEELQ